MRLLQGDTSIKAEALTIDETKGDLSANGKVMTTLSITEKDSAATTKPKPMVGRAGAFAYSDQTRTATYTTTAQLDGDQGNLRAAKIEMKLAKDENTLDGLEADGAVTALVDKRTVTGTHLSYAASRRQVHRGRRAGEDAGRRVPGDQRQDVDLLESVR